MVLALLENWRPRDGHAPSVSDTFQNLPISQKEKILRAVGSEEALETLFQISRSRNARTFSLELLNWALEQEEAGQMESAVQVYQFFTARKSATSSEYLFAGAREQDRQRAADRLAVLGGGGSWAQRTEFHLRRLPKAVADGPLWLGMAAGQTAFVASRGFLMPRILASTRLGLLGRGLGARFTGTLLSLIPESIAFWGATKGLNEMIHPGTQSWDLRTNLTELGMLFTTLTALRTGGATFLGAFNRFHGINPGQTATRLHWATRYTRPLFQGAGQVAGIALGHGTQPYLFNVGHPQALESLLLDSGIFALEFGLAGLASKMAFKRLHQHNETQTLRTYQWEAFQRAHGNTATARLHESLRSWKKSSDPPDFWGGAPALASGPAEFLGRFSSKNFWRGLGGLRARDFLVAMMGKEGTPGPLLEGSSTATPLPRIGSSLDYLRKGYTERGIRDDLPSLLESRTGKTKGDPFETKLSLTQYFNSLSPDLRTEIMKTGEISEQELIHLTPDQLGKGVGKALQKRIEAAMKYPDYLEMVLGQNQEPGGLNQAALGDILDVNFNGLPWFNDLPPELRTTLNEAAEFMGIFHYAKRSGHVEIRNSGRGAMDSAALENYLKVDRMIRIWKGPWLQEPTVKEIRGEKIRRAMGEEVIQPNLAVYSKGAGDMAAILKVIQHSIFPGTIPYYFRTLAGVRDIGSAHEIRFKGTYEKRVPGQIYNFDGDVPIEAVSKNHSLRDAGRGENDPLLLGRLMEQTVRVQMLNVPSSQLPEILSDEYIKGLPENAMLVQAIGGLREQTLVNDYIRFRLDSLGRQDVTAWTIAGFIPGKDMWRGKHIEVNISGPADPQNPKNPRPEALILAELLTGSKGPNIFRNEYITVTLSVSDRSNNLGKSLKNVSTWGVGYEAGLLARGVVETQEKLLIDSKTYKDDLQTVLELGENKYSKMRDSVWIDMSSFLKNNEVKPETEEFEPVVGTDYRKCSIIEFGYLVEVFRRAKLVDIQSWTKEDYTRFLIENVFNPKVPVASTRNPKGGIAQALYEMWKEMGMPFTYKEIMPDTAVEVWKDGQSRWVSVPLIEGRDSILPLMNFYDHPGHPIERRRLPDRYYQWARIVSPPDYSLVIPPLIPPGVRRALAGEIPGMAKEQLREKMGERSQASIDNLNAEIGIFLNRAARFQEEPSSEKNMENLRRQTHLLPFLVEAHGQGNLLPVRDFPVYTEPYENIFVIPTGDSIRRPEKFRVFLRVDARGIMDRLTQFGMLLRSFPFDAKVHLDVEVIGVNEEAEGDRGLLARESMHQIRGMARRVMTSFKQARPKMELSMDLNDTWLTPKDDPRADYDELQFARDLIPFDQFEPMDPLNPLSLVRQVRDTSEHTSKLMGDFLEKIPGWALLMEDYWGGPTQRALKAGFTRPERQAMIQLYGKEGQDLVATVMIYRGAENKPYVLNHHLMREFERVFPDNPNYQNLKGDDFFKGIPLNDFVNDFNIYAEKMGWGKIRRRVLAPLSLPVEMALAGRFKGVNPKVLRDFLAQREDPQRDLMLAELDPFYERPIGSVRHQVIDLIKKYLNPYHEQHREKFEGNRLYEEFENHGPKGVMRLVFRRHEGEKGVHEVPSGTVSSIPPRQ